jgi:hypothetical protein
LGILSLNNRPILSDTLYSAMAQFSGVRSMGISPIQLKFWKTKSLKFRVH